METSIHIYTAEAAFGPASAVYCSYAAPPSGSFGLRLLWLSWDIWDLLEGGLYGCR